MTSIEQPALFDGSWCQRWCQRRASWRRTSQGGFDPARYRVVAIEEQTARLFIAAHHYARTFPAARLRYGLLDRAAGEQLVGVAVLGVPMSAKVLTAAFPDLLPYRQSLELARLVLVDDVPANGESWFVARALRQAAAQGVRGVVMFSDPLPRRLAGQLVMPGHVGIVYQALGCRYTGRGTSRALTMLPDGSLLPARSAQKVRRLESGAFGVIGRLVRLGATPMDRDALRDPAGWLAHALEQIGARKVRHRGNHRYVVPVGDRGARRRVGIGLDPRPFPKRADPAE